MIGRQFDDQRHCHHDDGVTEREHQTRYNAGKEQLDDRFVREHAIEDERDTRRNENRDAAAGRDHASGHPGRITAFDHFRKGHDAHCSGHRGTRTRNRTEHHGRQDRCVGKAAGHPANHGIGEAEEFYDKAGSFHQEAGVDEERDRHQRVFVYEAEERPEDHRFRHRRIVNDKADCGGDQRKRDRRTECQQSKECGAKNSHD